MYKKSPNQYRAEQEFYPLQLRYVLNENLVNLEEKEWQDKIVFATQEDIPKWIELVHLVIDGFPHLDEKQYLEQLQEYINNKQALILKDSDTAIGIMAFHEVTGSIDFFGIHPQYWKREVAKAFCEKALYELARSAQISVTTFRKGDKADTGYREIWGSLGSPLVGIFAETGTPVYEIARNGFLIFPLSFLFCGLNIFTSATFTALSNGKLSAILSFLRTFGLITVLLLTLPNVLGVTGVWLAVPIAELITMIVALIFLYQNREKYHYT